MLSISSTFTSSMTDVLAFLTVVSDVFQLPSQSITSTTSATAFIKAAKKLRRDVASSNRIDVVAYDGAFLHVCAEFELVVRALIERYIERAVVKCPEFHNLPGDLRNWHPEGCASVILNIKHGRFKHLTTDDVIRGLAGAFRNRSEHVLPDVFSFNERNLKPDVIEECFNRIAIEKIWQKLSRESAVQTQVGTNTRALAEDLAKRKLGGLMDRRNDIIHRGKSYYTSSLSEVRDSVTYLNTLVTSLAEIMERSLAGI